MNEEDDLLSVSEVALMLNFSERYVRDLLNKDKLKGGRAQEKGKWLVKRGEVKRYIEAMGFGDEPQSEQKLESEADVGIKVTQVSTGVKDDPLLIEARKQHFEDLCLLIKKLEEEYERFPTLLKEYHSNMWTEKGIQHCDYGYIVYWPAVGYFTGEFLLPAEEDPLFGCLLNHLQGEEEFQNAFCPWRDTTEKLLLQLYERKIESELYDQASISELIETLITQTSKLIYPLAGIRTRRVLKGRCHYCP